MGPVAAALAHRQRKEPSTGTAVGAGCLILTHQSIAGIVLNRGTGLAHRTSYARLLLLLLRLLLRPLFSAISRITTFDNTRT